MATPQWISDYKDLAVAGSWLIAVAGWGVSNRSANKREHRKEVRTEIDACAKMAYEVLGMVREYLTTDPTDEKCGMLGAKIRFDLQRLLSRVERLESRLPDFAVCQAAGKLLDSITGGDFDSNSRKKLNPHSNQLIAIEADVHQLIEELENGFALCQLPLRHRLEMWIHRMWADALGALRARRGRRG